MPTSNSRCGDIDSRRALTSRGVVDVDAGCTLSCSGEGGGGNRPVRVVWINYGDALCCLVPVRERVH